MSVQAIMHHSSNHLHYWRTSWCVTYVTSCRPWTRPIAINATDRTKPKCAPQDSPAAEFAAALWTLWLSRWLAPELRTEVIIHQLLAIASKSAFGMITLALDKSSPSEPICIAWSRMLSTLYMHCIAKTTFVSSHNLNESYFDHESCHEVPSSLACRPTHIHTAPAVTWPRYAVGTILSRVAH